MFRTLVNPGKFRWNIHLNLDNFLGNGHLNRNLFSIWIWTDKNAYLNKYQRECIKMACLHLRRAVLLSPGQYLLLVCQRRLPEHCQHIHHVCAEIMSAKIENQWVKWWKMSHICLFLKYFLIFYLICSWVILRGSIFARYVPARVWGMEAFLFAKFSAENSLWRL